MMPCRIPQPGVLKESAQLLFHGRLKRIVSKSGHEVTPMELIRFECCRGVLEFEVLEMWKGEASSRIRVMADFQNGANCERTYYVGEEYVLWSFAEGKEGEIPSIENCHGIGRGGFPEELRISVRDFANNLGPPQWSARN